MNKEKPKQYQVGIDTFERMKANASFEEAMGFIRWNIDKYNTRKKGSDIEDYKKIKDYCDEAIWWLENKHVAEFNSSGGVKSEYYTDVDSFYAGDKCVILSVDSNTGFNVGDIVEIVTILNPELFIVSGVDEARRIVTINEVKKVKR